MPLSPKSQGSLKKSKQKARRSRLWNMIHWNSVLYMQGSCTNEPVGVQPVHIRLGKISDSRIRLSGWSIPSWGTIDNTYWRRGVNFFSGMQCLQDYSCSSRWPYTLEHTSSIRWTPWVKLKKSKGNGGTGNRERLWKGHDQSTFYAL